MSVKRIFLCVVGSIFSCGLATSVENDDHGAGDSTRTARGASDFSSTLRVVTIPSEPYLMVSNETGTPEYTGYLPDLMHLLSTSLDFRYEFYLTPDGRYGSYQSNGQWNGMVMELIQRKYGSDGRPVLGPDGNSPGADIAAADMTISFMREAVMDFVYPYQHLGVIPVVRLPRGDSADYRYGFSILKPFSLGLWALICLSFLLVGFGMGLLKRFNPCESGSRRQTRGNERAKQTFDWPNSFWFAFTTFSWQGFERGPRSKAARVLACFWLGFVAVTLMTYIGALTNQLWLMSMTQGQALSSKQMTSLADIVDGGFNEYKIGCISGGSTYSYMRASPIPIFQKIWTYWETEEGQRQLVGSNAEGIERASSGSYAFLMESTMANYVINRQCDLATIGQPFSRKGFGLGLPKDSPYLELFDRAMLQLQEKGDLERLENKWWYEKGWCQQGASTVGSMSIGKQRMEPIDVYMFWEVLVAMAVGVVLSVIVSVIEILYHRKHHGKTENGDGSTQGNEVGVQLD